MSFEREELKRRLTSGESLEVVTGGGSYEVWAEPYANPPTVIYEGCVLPYRALEQVIEAVVEALDRGEVKCRWVEPQGVHMHGCEEAYRARAAGKPARWL